MAKTFVNMNCNKFLKIKIFNIKIITSLKKMPVCVCLVVFSTRCKGIFIRTVQNTIKQRVQMTSQCWYKQIKSKVIVFFSAPLQWILWMSNFFYGLDQLLFKNKCIYNNKIYIHPWPGKEIARIDLPKKSGYSRYRYLI